MPILTPYLNFAGQCEEAFNFYKSVFGGEFSSVQRFGEAPGDHAPAESAYIMHIALSIGPSQDLMGSDRPSGMGPNVVGNNVHVSVHTTNLAETEHIFNGLAAGGQVTMPLQSPFWGGHFGMLTDKFRIQWMVNQAA